MTRLLAFLCLLMISCACTAQTITTTFKPGPLRGEDAGISTTYGCTPTSDSSPWESMNAGSAEAMDYMDWSFNYLGCPHGTRRVLIRFRDMDTLPSCASLKKAELKLFAVNSSSSWGTSYFPGSPYPLSNEGWVERVTGAWTEAAVTWDTQPAVTAVNRVAIPPSTARWGWTISVDVTTLAADILASGANNGFRISLQTESMYRAVLLASSDHSDPSLWPELVLTYNPSGGDVPVTASRDTFGCIGEQIPLWATGADTYTWSPATGLSSTTISNPILTVSGIHQYIVTGTTKEGCSGEDTVNITIVPGPEITALPADTSACMGSVIQLNASGGLNYKWTPSLHLSADNVPDPVATLMAPSTYIVQGTDNKGCIGYDTVRLTLKEGTHITASSSRSQACPGDTIQLSASGGKSYTWSPAAGLSADNVSDPVATVSGRVYYVVTGKDSIGCLGTDTVLIEAFPVQPITASSENASFNCNNPEVTLRASGGESYSWSPAVYCENPNAAITVVRPPHNTVFTVSSIDKNGCIASDTIAVVFTGQSEVKVPNAFSPNGDQINDQIRPLIVCNFILKEFAIYSRWGELLYRTNDGNKGWDGTFNGQKMNSDVYYYYVKGVDHTDKEVLFKGDIMLLR